MKETSPKEPRRVSTAGRLLHTWRSLDRRDRLLLCEALLMLSFARLAIRTLPFATVGRIATRGRADALPTDKTRAALVRRVRWAVPACARHLPFRAMCFEQGIAAQIMLRRRGVDSVLHYGAAQDAERGLIAHVWVRVGDTYVTGSEAAPQFAALVRFPPAKVS